MLVTLETGKLLQEGLGEVQEMIDICDFAVGLSRQLHGLTIASERPDHRMLETWHPLRRVRRHLRVQLSGRGVGVECGDRVRLRQRGGVEAVGEDAAVGMGGAPASVAHDRRVRPRGARHRAACHRRPPLGHALVEHRDVRLVSATGSTAMGRAVGEACARDFKRAILELGGNNAAIVCPSADLDLAARAIVFAAVGTAGQRCTTMRRLFVHRDLHACVRGAPARDLRQHPHRRSARAGDARRAADRRPRLRGDEHGAGRGGRRRRRRGSAASACSPTATRDACTCGPRSSTCPRRRPRCCARRLRRSSTSCRSRDVAEAIALNNAVRARPVVGDLHARLERVRDSSSPRAAATAASANVNIGTSGAEIGGAFGGEKDTGGGRESGSDAWRAYMRRATSTINYGSALPLAQGITFDV